MIFEQFVVGMLQTNCYLLADAQTKQAVVVDPGGDAGRISERIKALGLKLEAIVNTHAHFDHVMDAWTLKKDLGGEIFLHPVDLPILQQSMGGMWAHLFPQSDRSTTVPDRHLQEGDLLQYGAIRLRVLETPGHTPGHVSLYFQEADMVFVGDTVFAGSIGRTDLPGGSYDQLIRSVRTKIFTLDGKTVIYPGHGPETNVGREMRMNPFFR